jgi:predicted ATPase
MDNFEHVLEGGGLLGRILAHAPDVKILVTSRERLNLVEEWVYDVAGLAFPSSELEGNPDAYDAVRLFNQIARHVSHRFAPTPAQQSAVVRICQWVGGLPLGIELAASWVHVLPCTSIADEIQRSLDILETPARNMPPRHRNIRAVLDSTWRRLTPNERDVLQKLSVFQGGFSLAAAQVIAGASRSSLRSLIDKSLVRMTGAGRYALHELLRQYGEECLSAWPHIREQTLDAHRAYYMSFLGEREAQLVFLGQQKEATEQIEADLENLRAAWLRTVEQHRFAEMATGGEGLWGFY